MAAADGAQRPQKKKVVREVRPPKLYAERFASMAALQILYPEFGKTAYGARAAMLKQGKGKGTARDGMAYRHKSGEIPQNIVQLAAERKEAAAALNHPLWKVLGSAGKDRQVVLWVLANQFPTEIYLALCGNPTPTPAQLDPIGWHPYTLLQALLRIRRRNDLYALAVAICMAHLSHRPGMRKERYDAARYGIIRCMNALYFDSSTRAFARNVSLYIDRFYFPEVEVVSLRGHSVSLHGAQIARDNALEEAIQGFRRQDYWIDTEKWFPWRESGRRVDDNFEIEDLMTKDAFAVEMILAQPKPPHTSPYFIPIKPPMQVTPTVPSIPSQPRKRRPKP